MTIKRASLEVLAAQILAFSAICQVRFLVIGDIHLENVAERRSCLCHVLLLEK